jgi:hypothetical protein
MIGSLRRPTVERMPRGAGEEPRLTYLAEHYQPGLAVEELGRLAARVRESLAELELEGKQVRYLRTSWPAAQAEPKRRRTDESEPGGPALRRRGENDADRRSVYAVRRLSGLTRMEEP